MPWATILQLVLPMVKSSVELYAQARAALKQSGEWTPEDEAEFQATLDKAKVAPHWQQD